MAQGTIMPAPWQTFFTDAGVICSAHKVFVYAAGTTTKINTYSDSALTTPNANPYLLDSAGRMTAYLTPGIAYKFVLTANADSDPPVSPIKTQDNIVAVPYAFVDLDISGTAGEALSAGNVVYLSDGSGGNTAGLWYKTDADFTYASTTAGKVGMVPADIASAASGSIRVGGRVTGLSGLTAGVVQYVSATAGALTSTAPTNARIVGVADSTTSLVLAPESQSPASGTQAGLLSITAQTIAGVKTFSSPPVGIPTYARQTANVTKNANTTLANLTGLSFAIAASETWVFLAMLHGDANATADYKFTATGPAAPTSVLFGVLSSANPPGDAWATAFAGAVTASGAATKLSMSMVGLVRNGANAGTVQLQFAQNTSDVSDSIVYADSYLIAFRVA